MQKFDEKNPVESVILTFNYALGLPVGVTLIGTPIVTVANLYGGDPSPQALINGPPGIDVTGTQVQQPVTGGLDMNDYLFVAECPTTSPPWVLAIPAVLPVRAYPSRIGAT